MESDDEQSEPTSEPIDLSAIAAANPVNQRVMVLDLATFDASQLTLLEVLDMSEVAGVPPAELGALLSGGGTSQTPAKARMLYALAWVIMRRADATLRYSDVIRWRLDIKGKILPATDAQRQRTKARVGAAKLTGLPPAEAERLTVSELAAYREGQPSRPVRRAARRRKG